MRQPRVDELPGSPQVFDGLTAISETFTFVGSFTTMNLSEARPVMSPSWSVSLPQPVPCDWSMAPPGPQPNGV